MGITSHAPSPRRDRAGRRHDRHARWLATSMTWSALEPRVVPAAVSLASGALSFAAIPGESNDLTVELASIRGEIRILLTDQGPGVSLSATGSGLVAESPRSVSAPVAGLTSLAIRTGHDDDPAGRADAIRLGLGSWLPASVTVTAGTGDDRLVLVGTPGDDRLAMRPERSLDGLKVVRVSYGGAGIAIGAVDRLAIDLSADGTDEVTIDRFVSGLNRPLAVELIGGGSGTDSIGVAAEGNVPQSVEIGDGTIRVADDRDGQEVFLGRSDNVAIDQPRVAVEVIDESTGQPLSLGPEVFNTLLLDTGATGILFTDTPTSELKDLGYRVEGQYEEQGVAGTTLMDVSAPYRFDFAGESGERNTIRDVRMLSSDTLSFSFFGPWGIVGMPAMVGRVTTLDMSGWSTLTDLIDLYIKVDFSDAPAPASAHDRHVPLRLVDFPTDGRVGNDPVPTFAPLPFLPAQARDDGKTFDGEFLLDTGAQLSIISSRAAIAMGLDKNGNGTLDDEALDFIEVGGIGGTAVIPMVAFDRLSVPTTEGPELVWTDLLVGVLDIEVADGPRFDGVFGMDFLTSGWANKILPPLLGQPGSDEDGYFSHVAFDFRQAADRVGTMILTLSPEHDVVTAPRPDPLIIAHTGFDAIGVSSGDADDQFAVAPSASVAMTLDGGGHLDGDSLDLIPSDLTASDDGSTILVPGFQPIHHARFERVLASAANRAPALQPIADLTIPAAQDVVSVALSAVDPDGDALTYSAEAESLAYVLDQRLGLSFTGNYEANWGGRGEKWMQSSGGQWYFITPDGALYRWDNSPQATGELVATLDPSYHADPSRLHEARSERLAYQLDRDLGLSFTGNYETNWGGRGEKWMQSSGGQWHFITPDGALYRWDNSNQAAGELVATLDPSYHADPRGLHDAPVAVRASGATLTIDPAAGVTGAFVVTATADDGRGGTDSKPFTVTVTPASAAANRAPVLGPIADQEIPAAQDTLSLNLTATDPDGDALSFAAEAESLAYVLDQQLGLVAYHPGEDNWGGRGERWLTDAGGQWYFILPDGELYRWSGSGLGGTPLGNPGAGYHADPRLLADAQPGRPRAAVSVTGATLTVDREDGFVGAVVVTVTADDGRGGTDSKPFTVTVTTTAASLNSGASSSGGGSPGRSVDPPFAFPDANHRRLLTSVAGRRPSAVLSMVRDRTPEYDRAWLADRLRILRG